MKSLYLIRGVPGSGKSTLAKKLGDVYFEADMYFINENDQYVFNGADIKKAHEWCQNQVQTAMILNHTTGVNENIAVSNTFTQEWEMEPYYKMAKTYGYRIFTLVVESRHQSGNIHNVPEEVIEKMRERFSIFL